MKTKRIVIILVIFVCITIAYAADVKWSAMAELAAVPDAGDWFLLIDGATSKKIQYQNIVDNAIDTFSEIDTIVADKTLVNEEDAAALDALWTFGLGITITTGDPFTLGTNRIDNGSDLLDGEMIAADTIDDDSIDWADVTGVDITLTDCGAITSTGTITATVGFDIVGAADMDYGSADVLDHTFTTNDCTVILDGGITVSTGDTITLGSTAWNSGDGIDGEVIVADTIDNDSIDWGDMTDLTTDGAISANAVQGTDISIASEATGDIMYFNGTDWIRLAKGTAGQVLEVSADPNVPEWDTDDTGGSTAWDDIGNPDNSGLTTITFDNAELSLLTGDNDAAASFITIQNSDADHTGGNLYLLDLDYSADDGDADADFIKCQDSGGVVFSVQQDGDLVSTGTVDLNPAHTSTATIADITPSAVISTNEADWRGVLINGAALDPSGDDVLICGMHIDLSGVVPSGTGGDIDGIKLQMADGEKHAIHSEEGKIVIDNTVGSAAGAEYTVVDIRLNTGNLNANSEIHAIDVAVEAGTPSGKVVAMGTHTNVNPISQSIGTFSTPSQTEYAGERHTGGTVWVDGVDGSEIFIADDDAVYVGSTAFFNEIEVDMATAATKNVTPTFHYNTAADTWTEFFPADDTDGFQQDGTVRWDLDDISGSWTNDGDPCGVETSAGYWIKIVRTANADPGTPTPTTVKTGVITSYEWDKTGAIDVLSLEADTITEGGIAVHNNDQMDASSELLSIFDDETGTGVICFATSPTFTTSILAASQADIGSTSAEFGDIFIGDGKALKMGDDQDVTITHVADTGVQVELDDSIMFGDTAVFIESDDDGYLDLDADTGIRLNAATASTGTITAVGSFIIGAADMAEADLEKIDGITNGTAAANKAIVLSAGSDVSSGVDSFTATTLTDGTASLSSGALTGLTTPLTVEQGGTEAATFTDGAVLLGSGTGAFTALAVVTDGLIVIGDGSGDPTTLDVGSSTAITILGTIATGVWQGTAIADTYVDDNITIDLATLATTVTLGDDDATNDNQDIVFTTDAAGPVNLEADIGDFYYNPSTGTVTATEYVGGGAGVTAVDAVTGDSATAFFDAGTIEHEWGGLQADVSGWTGLFGITGADTSVEVDTIAELLTAMGDVTAFITDDDMPAVGTDPDTDADGEIGRDSDAANEPNDASLRGYDEGAQFLYARKLKTIQCTIIKPNDLADATRDLCPIWSNESGMTFTITKIEAWSDTDDTTLNVEVYDSVFGNNATVDALEIAGDGTANYYVTETTITAATIAANYIVVLDFDDTDDPGWVKISICGWFNADVD